MKPQYRTHFKSISFIDTSLLQFTMHSTDLVQYSLNHNGINRHFIISCITMFDICKRFWKHEIQSIESEFVTKLTTVSLCNEVYVEVLSAWHFMLKTDGSAPRNIFSFSSFGTTHT